MPASSPGRSTPVGLPKPKRRTHWSKRRAPSVRPISAAPTLEDSARMPATARVSQPRSCASLISRSATWRTGGRLNVVDGVTLPSSSAPATVNALNVEPGSYVAPVARLRHRVVGRLVELVRVDARPVGQREDRAVARVHHERGRALRPPRLADLGEHLLGVVLDVGVEREPDVLARARCACPRAARSCRRARRGRAGARRRGRAAGRRSGTRARTARGPRCRRCRAAATPSSRAGTRGCTRG